VKLFLSEPLGRKSIKAGESYQLQEPAVAYRVHFGVKNGDTGLENTCSWND